MSVTSLCIALITASTVVTVAMAQLGIQSEDYKMWKRGTDTYLRSCGYEFEWRHFTTKDGVNLTLHHVWKQFTARHGRHKQATRGVPVLFVHALNTNADMWFTSLRRDSFALLLADCGYDVWAINFRGTLYSPYQRPGVSITLDDNMFNDLPDGIDYILKERGVRKLHVVGMSKGTTVTFGALASQPEYNHKVRMFVAIVPVTYFAKPLFAIEGLTKLLGVLTHAFGSGFIRAFDTNAYWKPLHIEAFGLFIQGLALMFPRGETLIVNMLWTSRFSFERSIYNSSNIARNLHRGFPDTWSHHELLQFGQMACAKSFKSFDFAAVPRHYRRNSYEPHVYDLKKVTARTLILEASRELFSQPRDYQRTRASLKNLEGAYMVNFPNFQHVDPIVGINANGIYGRAFVAKMLKHDGADMANSQCSGFRFENENTMLRRMGRREVAKVSRDSVISEAITTMVKFVVHWYARDYCHWVNSRNHFPI